MVGLFLGWVFLFTSPSVFVNWRRFHLFSCEHDVKTILFEMRYRYKHLKTTQCAHIVLDFSPYLWDLLNQSTHHSQTAIFVYPNGFVYNAVCHLCWFYTFAIHNQNDIIFPVKYNINFNITWNLQYERPCCIGYTNLSRI